MSHKLIPPTDQEDKCITKAALGVPDNRPLTVKMGNIGAKFFMKLVAVAMFEYFCVQTMGRSK